MGKRIVLQILIVVAIVITAGCAGSPADQGETDSAGPTTTVPADTGADGSDGGEPDVDDDSAFSDPERALRDAGSFTSTYVWRVTDGDDVATSEIVQVVDLVAERSHVRSLNADETGDFLMDYYYADGMEYIRMDTAGSGQAATYLARQAEFEGDSMVYDHGYAYHESGLSDWSEGGTTTFDGVPVREYVYTGTDRFLAATVPTDEDGFDVSDIEFRMLVDSDGIARYQSFRVEGVDEDGQSQIVEWEYSLTDLGTTVLEDPDWFDEALAQTGGS